MPQLFDIFVLAEAESSGLLGTFGVDAPTLIAQTINFLLVFVLIYFFAVKPILSTLDERQQKITDGLQFAEDARIRLEEVEKQGAETLRKASVEAQALIQEARDNAKAILERETRTATEKAQALIAKGEEAIALEREQMLNEVRQEVTRMVVETTRKVLRRSLSDEDRTRILELAVDELSSTDR